MKCNHFQNSCVKSHPISNSVCWSLKESPTKNLLHLLPKIPRKPHQNLNLCWPSFSKRMMSLSRSFISPKTPPAYVSLKSHRISSPYLPRMLYQKLTWSLPITQSTICWSKLEFPWWLWISWSLLKPHSMLCFAPFHLTRACCTDHPIPQQT